MTTSEIVAAGQVVIRCPACGASEEADAAVLTDAPMIVCRECGETWPAAPPRTARRALTLAQEAALGPNAAFLQAERRALVSYSDGADDAWAAKLAGDILPETQRRSRVPRVAAAIAAALFLAAFFGGRERAVAALPDLGGLYAAFGMPVNLDGLAIEDLAAERTRTAVASRIVVRGAIRNPGRTDEAAPPLVAMLFDEAGAAAGSLGFDPPARTIAAGQAEPFVLEMPDAGGQAAEIVVRFGRPAERLPAKQEGGIANP